MRSIDHQRNISSKDQEEVFDTLYSAILPLSLYDVNTKVEKIFANSNIFAGLVLWEYKKSLLHIDQKWFKMGVMITLKLNYMEGCMLIAKFELKRFLHEKTSHNLTA